MDPCDLRHFSTHEVWTEEPDVLCIRFVGHVRGRDLREMIDYRNTWAQGRDRFFLLFDMSALTGADSEARRVMTEERAAIDRRQVSINFGASFTMRVIAEMMYRSLRILRPGVEHADRIFVATEAEARALIEKRRREFAEEARGST